MKKTEHEKDQPEHVSSKGVEEWLRTKIRKKSKRAASRLARAIEFAMARGIVRAAFAVRTIRAQVEGRRRIRIDPD